MTPTDLHVVLGAGPAGTTLSTELARRGHRVRLVDRRDDPPVPAGVEHVRADLSDADAATSATRGASVIYHCVNVAYHLQPRLLPGLGEAILTAAERQGARLVVLDTLYPYGEANGESLTEDTPWAATTVKGRLRADLDRRYLRAHEEGRVRVVAGRSADFYGPGVLNSTLGGAVFPAALTGGEVLTLLDTSLPHSYTYIRDVARGLATLGERPEGDGRIWHLPTVPARSTDEVLELVARAVGRPLRVHNLRRAEAYGPFDQTFMDSYAEMLYQHRIPQNMVSTAFEHQFGVFPTPLEEGIAQTLAWYREVLAGQWAAPQRADRSGPNPTA
ncbi:nucleoside-diphosphate-sugar epimerase [Deinococcus budaensis]|uniref:Nucleoside-diphosphate-sugar epimerase n=1 Tax=Deinococcus budaensis TaxID=1665626 RepID=A0A7W8GFM9_9DEIO|nr:NAD-dependent epimerase/dehydratase family protein [Deinococcus budaensis]MBB5234732.1 nucleoside-diphosphate-sugar epimerase [Deinococcus budaensis]